MDAKSVEKGMNVFVVIDSCFVANMVPIFAAFLATVDEVTNDDNDDNIVNVVVVVVVALLLDCCW